jgi:curli biogenesis system outer membrane secretion channel CsgG
MNKKMILVGLVAALSSCTPAGLTAMSPPPPVDQAEQVPDSLSALERPTEVTAPEPVALPVPFTAATHILSKKLAVRYWVDKGTLNVSAAVEGKTAANVLVSHFTATGCNKNLKNDTGPFTIAPPYSYTTALDTQGCELLQFEYGLSFETYKKSDQFYRMTFLDTLDIGAK